MTMTYEKLKKFTDLLKKDGFELQITESELNQYIMRNFGVSDYTLKSVKVGLTRVGLIKLAAAGIYELV